MKNHKKIESVSAAIKIVDKYVGRPENLEILEALGILALNHHSRKECSCGDCESDYSKPATPEQNREIIAQLNDILPECYENQDKSLVLCFKEIVQDWERAHRELDKCRGDVTALNSLLSKIWNALPVVYKKSKQDLPTLIKELVQNYTESAEAEKLLRQVNATQEKEIRRLKTLVTGVKNVGKKK